MTNDCLDAVKRELELAKVDYRIDHGGKHVHIRFGPNLEHMHVVPFTPSDYRGPLNARASIRRQLASTGEIGEAETPAPSVSLTIVDGAVTCTSYEIAERFSKSHKDVLRAIDNVRENCGREFDRDNFAQIDYLDEKGRKYRAYRMTRDGFMLVGMGFTGAAAVTWKIKYIEAFNAMEREINRLASGADLGSIRADIETVFSLVADIEARALTPPPSKKTAFLPPSMIARRTRRTETRRSANHSEAT